MRLAEDDRGRVPFALVGVLLLLGSTAFATTLSTRGVVHDDRAVDRAMEHVRTSSTAALRDAVREAARDAAREPVTATANTSFGRVLDEDDPFRDALRVRIYVVARAGLRETRYRRQNVRASASLQPTPTPAALRAATRRVTVEPVESGTAVRVRVRNVTYTATRGGRSVVHENRTVEVTVATPVLALHDRVQRFERRLNRDPVGGSGLGRRLTARLYPITWARGYAQRYGAPVENVLANRHVAVSTNGAVLETERAVFGRSDPGGTRGLRRAHGRLLARDLTAPVAPATGCWTRRVLRAPNAPPDGNDSLPAFDRDGVPGPERNTTVRVGTTAERSLGRMLAATGNHSFDGATRAGYRARVRLRTATEAVEREDRPDPDPPGSGFDLKRTSLDVDTTVTNATAPLPAADTGEQRFAAFERRVIVHRTVTRRWEREDGNETDRATTASTWSETYRVGVLLTGEPDHRAPGPNRTVSPVFRPGGPLHGPNMADVPDAARTRLVDAQGGPDGVAARAARDAVDRRTATVTGDRPAALDRYVYADLRKLRDRVRNVTVAARRGRVATGRTNPPARLAARLRDRRTDLVAAPETYRGAADRARIAARATYLDRVIGALDRRSGARRDRVERFDELVRDRTNVSLDGVHRTIRARRNVSAPDRGAVVTGPNGPVAMVPDASPAYLVSTDVGHGRAAAVSPGTRYHPLATRNVNLFTVPYGGATDVVVGENDSGYGEGLRAAGDVLVAADQLSAADRRVADRRALQDATGRTLDAVRDRWATVLRRRTALDGANSRAVVRTAFARWNGTGRRARAVSNGSAAEAVAAVAVDRLEESDPVLRDRLATELRAATTETVARSRIDGELVERAAAATRDATGTTGTTGSGAGSPWSRPDDAADAPRRNGGGTDGRRGDAGRARILAGLPVAPSPGHWYLTVNLWTVHVRGAYARFAVRTRRGAPGESLRYARDGSWVEIDVDGDGSAERLGLDERVAFETNTSVVVAVPPYGPGVGDVDGDADERSPGWPHPECLPPVPDACGGPAPNSTRVAGRPRPAE